MLLSFPGCRPHSAGTTRRRATTILSCALAVAATTAAHAQTAYTSRTSFLADPGTSTTTTVNFDSLAVGTNLTGQTIGNATFNAPATSPLSVIAASTGVRFPMSASSGANVLSPGGTTATLEDDDLEIVFGTAVRAAGLDVVFDVPDGSSFVGVTFFDAQNTILHANSFIPAPSGAPGFQFYGFVSTSANIKRIVFDDFDGTANDDNVAYDTLTYSVTASAAPEPGSLVLALGGFASFGAGAIVRRRRQA